VEFCRFQGESPVAKELLALKGKDVQLATEVVSRIWRSSGWSCLKNGCTRSKEPTCGSCVVSGSSGSPGRRSSRRGAGFSS